MPQAFPPSSPSSLSVVGALLVSFIAVPAAAQVLIPNNALTSDLYYARPVQLVTTPQAGASVPTTKTDISGTGTLTIGAQREGGFPRVGVRSGTVVTTRAVTTDSPWNGVQTPPAKIKPPSVSQIQFASPQDNPGAGMDVLSAYQVAPAGYVQEFTPAAQVAFRPDQPDGTQLHFALPVGGQWLVRDTDTCTVREGVCLAAFSQLTEVALVRVLRPECPVTAVANGTVSPAPACRVQCHPGFVLTLGGDGCQPQTNDDDVAAQLEAELAADLGAELTAAADPVVAPVPSPEVVAVPPVVATPPSAEATPEPPTPAPVPDLTVAATINDQEVVAAEPAAQPAPPTQTFKAAAPKLEITRKETFQPKVKNTSKPVEGAGTSAEGRNWWEGFLQKRGTGLSVAAAREGRFITMPDGSKRYTSAARRPRDISQSDLTVERDPDAPRYDLTALQGPRLSTAGGEDAWLWLLVGGTVLGLGVIAARRRP